MARLVPVVSPTLRNKLRCHMGVPSRGSGKRARPAGTRLQVARKGSGPRPRHALPNLARVPATTQSDGDGAERKGGRRLIVSCQEIVDFAWFFALEVELYTQFSRPIIIRPARRKILQFFACNWDGNLFSLMESILDWTVGPAHILVRHRLAKSDADFHERAGGTTMPPPNQ